jgi:hypothetical protein
MSEIFERGQFFVELREAYFLQPDRGLLLQAVCSFTVICLYKGQLIGPLASRVAHPL